jgi:hypothetical protein
MRVIMLAERMTTGEDPFVEQFQMQRDPRSASDQGPLDNRRSATDMLDQHLFVGAQEPAFAGSTADRATKRASIDDAAIWTDQDAVDTWIGDDPITISG